MSPADLEREFIKKALDRKRISHGYHTTLPMFLKSQGPFAVYDHAMHRGTDQDLIFATATEQALNRHNDDVDRLRQQREFERGQFYSNIDAMQKMADMKHEYTRINN